MSQWRALHYICLSIKHYIKKCPGIKCKYKNNKKKTILVLRNYKRQASDSYKIQSNLPMRSPLLKSHLY